MKISKFLGIQPYCTWWWIQRFQMEEIWILWDCLQAHIFEVCRAKLSGHFRFKLKPELDYSLVVRELTWHRVHSNWGKMTKIRPIYQYLRVNCYLPMKHVWPYSMKILSKLLSFQWLEAKILLHNPWWPQMTSLSGHVMSHLSREKVTWCWSEFFMNFEIQNFWIRGFSAKWPHFFLNDFIFPVKFTTNDKDLDRRSLVD